MTNNNESEITLQEITEDTLWPILELEVGEDQKKFVAANATSIAEAHFSDYSWFRAIYAGDQPVGFVLLYIDEDEAEFDLWRMMIDKSHQRKGYGTKALELVVNHIAQFPEAKELTLSYLPGRGDPGPFFEKFGFVESDEWIDDEIVLTLDLTGY